jgi:hypothetical protein
MKETGDKQKENVEEIIESAIKLLEKKYSFEVVKKTCNRYFVRVRDKKRLEQEIAEKKKELALLEKKAGD